MARSIELLDILPFSTSYHFTSKNFNMEKGTAMVTLKVFHYVCLGFFTRKTQYKCYEQRFTIKVGEHRRHSLQSLLSLHYLDGIYGVWRKKIMDFLAKMLIH